MSQESTAAQAALETSGLSVCFGEYQVLRGLTLRIPLGSFCAVLGPNGGGKSTLLKVALGLLRPSAGSMEVLGQAAGSPGLAKQIGYVPQVKTLDRSFPAQARDLVVSGLTGSWPWRISAHHGHLAEKALLQAGAAGLLQRQLSVLSGGELQRVYLARALVRQPQLILLDEPAAGIDAAGEDDMYHVLEHYQQESGASVVMVTHDWGAALHHADYAVLLKGRLIAAGEPSEVLSDENLREAFGHSGHSHAMGRLEHGGHRHA